MAHTEVDADTILLQDTVLEWERNPSLTVEEAIKLAKKYPGRCWPGYGRNSKPSAEKQELVTR